VVGYNADMQASRFGHPFVALFCSSLAPATERVAVCVVAFIKLISAFLKKNKIKTKYDYSFVLRILNNSLPIIFNR